MELGLIVSIFFLAFCQSSATLFFYQNIREGKILAFYGRLLSKIKSAYIRSVLGECPFCFNFYVGIVVYLVGTNVLGIGLDWQWYWHVLAYVTTYFSSNSMLNFLIFHT